MPKQDIVLLLLISFIDQVPASTYTRNNAGLTAVPGNIPEDSIWVYLQDNSLTAIGSTDFAQTDKLQKLFLDRNSISSISPNAFDTTNMIRLELSGNPIKHVPFFAGIDSGLKYLMMPDCQISDATWNGVVRHTILNELSLSNNRLTTVPDVSRTRSTLRKLSLDSNSIETLDTAKLDGCNVLTYLTVADNGLKQINGILKLPALTKLFLSTNALINFPDISLLPNLLLLNLSDNQIQSIPSDSFVNNPNLQTLYMDKNQLHHMPLLNGAKNSLEHFWVSYNSNITFVPTDYFGGFTKLTYVDLGENNISSITFAKSIGPTVETLSMTGNKINNVPAGTFTDAAGMQQIILSNNGMTNFNMSNIKHMPLLTSLQLHSNRLTEVENAYTYCRGASCTGLTISLGDNPLPCNRVCWAKRNTTITVSRDDCSGTPWDNVTLNYLKCPTREQVMKLAEKRNFAGTFESYELVNYDYKKTQLGPMVFMKCIGTCLTTENCTYFKHGNRTRTHDVDHKETQDCAIWTPGP